MVPGIILLMLSFLIGRRKTFILSVMLFTFSFLAFSKGSEGKEDKRVKSEKTLALESQFIQGSLDNIGKQALASSLLKDNYAKEAASLFKEINQKDVSEDNKVSKFNEATALLKAGRAREGVNEYNKLIDHFENNPTEENKKLLKTAKSNIAKLFQVSQSSSKSKNKDKDEDEQESKKDQKSESGEGKEKKEDKDNKESKEDEKKNQEEDKGESGDKSEEDKTKDEKKDEKPESSDEKEERKKKLPTLLKQLINDDNQLQKKMIDAKTTKRKSYDSKDW